MKYEYYVIVLCLVAVIQLGTGSVHPSDMSKKTVRNEKYQGLLEAMCIPAELHVDPRDGAAYAGFGSAVPIHRCTQEQVLERAKSTHHYSGVFTELQLAPLAELAYVRVDPTTAEKVFINRNKRILLRSSDEHLAQWRCAPTFESTNDFLAGTPIVDANGALLSIVTARKGNHYAISNIEGPGGYFDTTEPWNVVSVPEGHLVYGTRSFPSRAALREFVATLPPGAAAPPGAPNNFTPSLLLSATPRITLTSDTGRQIAHNVLDGVIVKDIEYL